MKPQSTTKSFRIPPVFLFGVAYIMALAVSVFICISIYNHYSESNYLVKKDVMKNQELVNTAAIVSQH